MRWELLFADLQSQLAAGEQLEDENTVLELTEAETAQVGLADRLRARSTGTVTLRLRGGQDVTGSVLDAAPGWFLLAEGERRVLVPATAVVMVWPLGGAAPPTPGVERRLRVTHALRALARQGFRVRVSTDVGDVVGWVVRVGADHLDVRPDRDGGAGAPVPVTVPLGALLAVRTT
ncbi:hypothetical protein PU560_03720 [Georgenia sp. 10Sc9-8]|uniref:Fis family transcriptional regulator n=1 Tax=Georgenia halotolerans TaxID=3028317 RepID=A0ABT5TU45_9MICO|nr:hypothetical protein [Georgenia halotolerans]